MNAESPVTTPGVSPESAPPAIEICDVWKSYRTGVIRGHTLIREFESLLARLVGRADPNSHVLDRGAITTEATGRNVRFWAVQGVSFSVAKGEVVALLGRNGAGKSTLLQILCRITEADRGVIRTRGRLASLLGAGVGFNDELTGRENVFLNGSILGMQPSEIESRIASIAEFAEIPEFMDTPVKRYSNGMRARLGFSVAVHLDADIMILDEVFATGDRVFRMKCIERIRELAERGRTILIVTHIPEMLKGMCNRGVVLDKGRLVFNGPIDNAIEKYASSARDQASDTGGHASTEVPEQEAAVTLRRFVLLNKDGDESRFFSSEESVIVRIEFDSNEPFDSLGAALWVRAKGLGTLIQFHTDPGAMTGVELGESIVFEITIDRLSLCPKEDDYSILLRIFCGGKRYRVLCERSMPIWIKEDETPGKGYVRCLHRWDYRRQKEPDIS